MGLSPPAAPAPSLPTQALTLQPRLMTNQLSSIRTSFLRALFNTDRAAEKSAIYGIIETRFFEGKKGKFNIGFDTCTTQQSCLVGLNRRRKQFNPGLTDTQTRGFDASSGATCSLPFCSSLYSTPRIRSLPDDQRMPFGWHKPHLLVVFGVKETHRDANCLLVSFTASSLPRSWIKSGARPKPDHRNGARPSRSHYRASSAARRCGHACT